MPLTPNCQNGLMLISRVSLVTPFYVNAEVYLHCAVRQVSSMYESTMGISYMKKMQFFMWNLNLWSKRLNGLSHRVYQIKNSKLG